VREVERITQSSIVRKASRKPAVPMSPELEQLQKRLQDQFGTRVRIRSRKPDGSTGRIEIDYYNVTDLERIFEITGIPYLL
jgi:hypothetical protein